MGDYKIIKCLMRHYMTTVQYKNQSPNYINNLFKSFCDSKKYVHININWMNCQYPGFKKYLMCSVEHGNHQKNNKNYDNMLSLEIIAALFPYCEEIIVWETGKISRNYVSKLVEQLNILNVQQRSILRTIKLCNVRYNEKLLNTEFEKEYAMKFDHDAFCRIHVDIKVRLQHENQHNNLFKEIPEYSHLIITRQYKKYKASLKRKRDLSFSHIINGLDNDHKHHHHRHKKKNKKSNKNKQRSRSYHRNKFNKKRDHTLPPLGYTPSRQLTAV